MLHKKKIAAIILAAGSGLRASDSSTVPKQYKNIGHSSVIRRSIEAFLSCSSICDILVAIAPHDTNFFYESIGDLCDKVQVVFGGVSRQESAYLCLEALEALSPDIVLIHDAARPFLDTDLILRILEKIENCGVLPAIPLTETIQRVDASNYLLESIHRDKLYSAQTPQGFPYHAIWQAHKKAKNHHKLDFTDDSSLAFWAGMPIKIINGSVSNKKITWPEDLQRENRLIENHKMFFPDIRVGKGYDVHAFHPGDHVVLCGVRIPHTHSLHGHSDADVVLHALTDALLATNGSGDIGVHFPPSEMKWKDCDSCLFLRHAFEIVVLQHKAKISNVDIMLICESPKISPYREEMIGTIMRVLEIPQHRVSLKATTNEKLGFIGRNEGIAAFATACVVFPGEIP